FTKPAGELMAAEGIFTGNASYAIYIPITSDAALAADLAPSADGQTFPLPPEMPGGVRCSASGALIYASDAGFGEEVKPLIAAELAKPVGPPGATITL